jgi:hypothetical protein
MSNKAVHSREIMITRKALEFCDDENKKQA